MLIIPDKIWHYKDFPRIPPKNWDDLFLETINSYKLSAAQISIMLTIHIAYLHSFTVTFQDWFHFIYIYDSVNGNDIVINTATKF